MALVWNGDYVKKSVFALIYANLVKAIQYLTQAMKINIGIQGPPRSAPYEFPHMDTTELNKSIDYSVDQATLTARIGTDDEKAVLVEFGEPTIAPRPFFNRTLAEEQDRVIKILGES